MRQMTKMMLVGMGLTLTTGCLMPAPQQEAEEKKDARKQVEKGSETDYCELYAWYGDGQCDDFCARTDSDCVATCLAEPTCAPGEVAVERCEADAADCHDVTMCGSTIGCKEAPDSCNAYPACPTDMIEVDACIPDSECLQVTVCGATIICQENLGTCTAIPVCPADKHEVEVCTTDAECLEVTTCGATILCQDGVQCALIAPTCADGYEEVDSCPTDVDCYEESNCAGEVACRRVEPACEALPACDADQMQVETCPQDASCESRTLCGTTILCLEP